MNIAALKWAGRQQCPRPFTKLVLLAYAHHANRDGLAWPSNAALVEFTGLERKTVIREVKALARVSLMEDSGDRRGLTGQIKVWRLAVEQEALPLSRKGAAKGTLRGAAKSPNIRDSLFDEDEQKESRPAEQSRQRPERVPPGGTRKDIEGSKRTDVLLQAAQIFGCPEGVPKQAWADFLKSRKRRRASMSETAYSRICGNLNTLAEHGYPPGDMVALAVEHGWLTVKLEWVQNAERTKGTGQSPDGLSSTARAAIQVFGR